MSLAPINGGSSQPSLQPQDHPQTYNVRPGDTLNYLSRQFGVSEQAIRQANPQIFGDHLRVKFAAMDHAEIIGSGDVLNIPAASMSVTEDPPEVDVNPTFTSSNSEYQAGPITYNPGDGTVKFTHEQEVELGKQPDPLGVNAKPEKGVAFSVKNENSLAGTYKHQDGKTEIAVESEVSVSLEGKADAGGKKGGASLDASAGSGVRARYKVTLPDQNGKAVDPAQAALQAAKINPFDPSTLPPGATVTLDKQDFVGTSLEASFRYMAMKSEVKDADGTALSITRGTGEDANQVTVYTGPTKAVEAFNGVGVKVGDFTAFAGRQDALGQSKLRTATFDLTNKDAQAAYSRFLATGQIADQTPGVQHVATIEKLDMASQTRLKAGIGDFGIDLAGAENTGSSLYIHYPDGSTTVSTQLKYSGNVPLTITQRYDIDGMELIDQRRYEFQVKADDNHNTDLLNVALTGSITALRNGYKPVPSDGTTKLVFDDRQMEALMGQTRKAADATLGFDKIDVLAGEPDHAPTSMEFAISMARNLGNDDYGFSKLLFDISDGADGSFGNGRQAIDASVQKG